MSATDEVFARVLEFQRRSVELTADRVTPIDEGWVIRTPAWPEVWSHNQVWVREPIGYQRAIELCREHLSDGLFWQLFLEEWPGAEALVEELRAHDWEVDVEVHQRLVRATDREVDASAVTEPAEEESLELMARWYREDPTLDLSEDGVRQSCHKDCAVWRLRQARRYGIRDRDGSLAAITQLFTDGGAGQVEHVYTRPDCRGRGYARALVTHAAAQARAAGYEPSFIVADDNDWPQQLYGRIGFEPLGRTWLLHLPGAKAAAVQ
jgi:ribosomal protein S18 acetylase RimI-like enzyme